ncbi:MAG: site-specific integrase [Myxococcales bacterium]|nr:site-specific integrase [Myxococcales bacterium]
MATKWVERWKTLVREKPVLPGVYPRKDGGFVVRALVTIPGTEKRKEVWKTVEAATPLDAKQMLVELVAATKAASHTAQTPAPPPAPMTASTTQMPFFGDYAATLKERKERDGTFKSESGKGCHLSILKEHILPTFGPMRVDEIRKAQVLAWKDTLPEKVQPPHPRLKRKPEVALASTAKHYSPHTMNGWLRLFSTIITAAVEEFELPKNPVAGLTTFDTSETPTYTHEEPNSATPEETKAFLSTALQMYPQHFAMMVMGFVTGLRPSSLRPIRRSGPERDLLWEEKALLVRRSHTRTQKVMNTTKTGRRQRIGLPDMLIVILHWHVDSLPPGPMRDSDLLFPSAKGKLRSQGVLDKPFKAICKALGKSIGLRKKLTPRAMRRTFQDLTRLADVRDLVTRSISGHATSEMQEHYSTPLQTEQRDSLTRVLSLTGIDKVTRLSTASVAPTVWGNCVGEVAGMSGAMCGETAERAIP